MEKLHTLILLLSCSKTQDRRDACRETWLARPLPPGMKAVFLMGRPGQPASLDADVLYLDCPDAYVDLAKKTWTGIREAFLRWDFDWLFKADDDTWINPVRLYHYPKTRDYMGRKVCVRGPDPTWHETVVPDRELVGPLRRYGSIDNPDIASPWMGPWAGGGVGYFLSRRAARLVADEPFSHVERELYEDKFVGDVMASHGIFLYGKHATLKPLSVQGKKTHLGNIMGATTIHPLTPELMRETYWRLLREGEMET